MIIARTGPLDGFRTVLIRTFTFKLQRNRTNTHVNEQIVFHKTTCPRAAIALEDLLSIVDLY